MIDINSFPNEIKLEIFKFSSSKDRNSHRRVCKEWNEVINNIFGDIKANKFLNWKKFRAFAVTPYRESITSLDLPNFSVKILKNLYSFPNLKKIEINGQNQIVGYLHPTIQEPTLPFLKEIHLRCCKLTCDIFSYFQYCSKLEVLNLSASSVLSKHFYNLPKLSQLKNIDITNIYLDNIIIRDVNYFRKIKRILPNFFPINLERIKVSSVYELNFSSLTSLKQLKEICILYRPEYSFHIPPELSNKIIFIPNGET